MNKGNHAAIFGGLAGIVTVGALAFTTAAGSTAGALTPAAGGVPGSTATSATPLPNASDDGKLPNASDDGKLPNASDDGKPTATATQEPKPTEAPEPTKAPKPQGDDKFDLPPGVPSVSDYWQEGFTLTAYPGYCTAAQSMEHLRSSTIRFTAPDALEGIKGYSVRIEGAGKGAHAYFKVAPGQSIDTGAFPMQWSGTNDDFAIVVDADEEGTGTAHEVARLSSKNGGADFAHKASRWCDAKPVNDAPKTPTGNGTGPIIQAG